MTETLEMDFAPYTGTFFDPSAEVIEVPRQPQRRGGSEKISTIATMQSASVPVALPDYQPSRSVVAKGFKLRLKPGETVAVFKLGTKQPQPEPKAERPRGAKAAAVSKEQFVKHREHLLYLKRVSTEETPPLISPEIAKLAQIAWQDIWIASGRRLPVPAACTGPDGEMFYSWDKGRHHLELEIIPEKPAEFFYRDREGGEYWAEDYVIGSPLPEAVVKAAKYFI